MTTTVFSTHASTRRWPEDAARHDGWRRWLRALAAAWLLLLAGVAQGQGTQVLQESLQRSPDGVYLSARIDIQPSAVVQDTLLRSVPLHFVWQADVYRDRWYWSDQRLARVTRTLRLAYQPLTRRWRLSLSDADADGGLGLRPALHQNFDSLGAALAALGRVSDWKVAEADQLPGGARLWLAWSLQLDLSLLPRPFQIGVVNQPQWQIQVRRRLPVPAQVSTEPDPQRSGLERGAADAGR